MVFIIAVPVRIATATGNTWRVRTTRTTNAARAYTIAKYTASNGVPTSLNVWEDDATLPLPHNYIANSVDSLNYCFQKIVSFMAKDSNQMEKVAKEMKK